MRPIEQLHLGGGTPTFLTVDQIGCVVGSLERHFGLAVASAREFSIEVDPRTVTPDTLTELAGLGFDRISLGVQDFDPAVQAAVNRVQSPEATLALIAAARDAGMRSVALDLIYGLPLQSLESWGRTLDRVVQARPNRVAAYGYAHLPERFKAQARIDPLQLPSASLRLDLMRLTMVRLLGAGYVQIGMDHFALPGDALARAAAQGTLQRNFQGYSTHGGLEVVGIGMSAIGRVDNCYAQNARTLDRYYQAIDEGRLAIECGVRLSDEDRLRRAVIMQLMCTGRVDFADFAAQHGRDFAACFAGELERLVPLSRDGLVRVDAGGITCTEAGRLLVRAVARVFDAYAATPSGTPARRHSAVV